MAFKFEIIDNAVQVTDTGTSEVLIAQPAKDTWYVEESLDKGLVELYGTTGTNEDNIKKYRQNDNSFNGFDLAQCVDAGDTTFTGATFRSFCYLNLGKSSSTADGADTLDNRVIVNQSNYLTTICGTIDSTKEYFLDGIIDIGANSITVPPTGIEIKGYSFDNSGLISSEDNFKMFISESIVIGSGNLLASDFYLSVTGLNSKIYELYDATGLNAIELQRVNYIDCTSLGDLFDYRQGLEFGTGRFGGSPSLTLHGLWSGGFRITTSITRNMSDTTTEPLFKEGILFQMNSRFLTDINCDLGSLQSFTDFSASNFANPGTVQFSGCEITRDGVYNAEDSNLTPNLDRGDLACYWKQNNGLPNTFVGGTSIVVSEETTTVSAGSTWYTMEGIFSGDGLEHFSASADGGLTHLGNSPREFEVTGSLTLDSNPNNVLRTRFRRWDDSEGVFINLDYTQQIRQVNSLVGGRDVAFFTIVVGAVLDQNDYLQLQVRNDNGNNDIVCETGSYFRVQER